MEFLLHLSFHSYDFVAVKSKLADGVVAFVALPDSIFVLLVVRVACPT